VISGEHLTIDTPEQVALELPVAGIGSRFMALALDTVCQGLIFLILVALLGGLSALNALSGIRIGEVWGPALIVLLIFCLYWGYFAIFEIVWKGQTPGKRAAGIRVIKDSGRPIDALSAILRNLMRAIDLLPGMYGVGVVTMVLNRHSRRLGDFVAGTIVVHDKPAARLAEMPIEPPPRAFEVPLTTHAVRLSDGEVVLIETYLARRFEYAEGARGDAAARIVERISRRLGVAPAHGEDPDLFLESLLRQARDAARYR
jgi:uncharacterized RDD family membrane protein YckC